MRSVYLKIFLWFWLAVLAVGLTLVLTALALRRDSRRDEALGWKAQVYLAVEAKQAVADLEQHGEPAVDELLESAPFVYQYLLDAQGRDVRGLLVPPEARRLAGAVNAAAPYATTKINGARLAAQWISGPGGRPYELVLVVPPFPMRLLLWNLGPRAIIGLIAVSLVAGILCFWLARHITRPLVRLREIAGKFADGRLDTRVDADIQRRGDEIGGLGRSFDRMAERIASLLDAQRRLLTVVSHELRSPLTRLSLTLGLLRRCSDEEKMEYLDRTELEVEHLEALIGQLLRLARIDAGADSDRAERFDLGTVVQEVAADGNFEAQRRCCSVIADCPATLTMQGVAENIRRAIENPLRNAIRHTQPNTSVQISMRRRAAPPGAVALIQIRDHGPGVPADSLGKIFLPFHKVAGAPATGGTGLGLAITERIVRSHGGNVWATNAFDGGLIVAMELPLSE